MKYTYVLTCCLPAVEPDWECADWQAEWGKQSEWIKGGGGIINRQLA